jgi:hypothetical protein
MLFIHVYRIFVYIKYIQHEILLFPNMSVFVLIVGIIMFTNES